MDYTVTFTPNFALQLHTRIRSYRAKFGVKLHLISYIIEMDGASGKRYKSRLSCKPLAASCKLQKVLPSYITNLFLHYCRTMQHVIAPLFTLVITAVMIALSHSSSSDG